MQSEWFDKIELTEDELKAAITEAKKKKYFRERNKEYWEAQENVKIVKKFTKNLAESQRDIDPEIAKVVNKRFWELL